MLSFKLWLEAIERRPRVFCDLDDTLLHRMPVDWLKDSAKNKDLFKCMITGCEPHPEVKLIKIEGKEEYIFPRPSAIPFLKEVLEFADIYLLSHAQPDFITEAVHKLGFAAYLHDWYSTREQTPNSLRAKTGKQWVLVDDMPINSLEVVYKFRILGLNFCESELSKCVNKELDDHFVRVESWRTTIEDTEGKKMDSPLTKKIAEIKRKLNALAVEKPK